MTPALRRVPWTPIQVRTALVADAAAAVVILAAALGSRDTAELSGQVLWLNLAVLGLAILCVSHGGLILAARRAIGHRIAVVVPALPAAPAETAPVQSESWVWIPGTKRAHQPGCVLIAGKDTLVVDSSRIRHESLHRCEACG